MAEDRMMPAAETLSPTISDPMTWEEICARYPDQFVLLVDADPEPGWRSLRFRTARVAGCGATRRDLVPVAHHWFERYKVLACRYTGKSPTPLIRPTYVYDDAP